MAQRKISERKQKQAHDQFFTSQFSNKTVVQDFIRQFLPPELVEQLDLDALELDPTAYVTKQLKRLFSDLVWICFFKAAGKAPIRLAFLMEHKSDIVLHPHFQLLQYLVEIWRVNQRNKEPFLPVIPIIF